MDTVESLKKRIGVVSIMSLDDIAKINQFVFNVVPCPLLERMRTKLKGVKLSQWNAYFDAWEQKRPDPSACLGNWCGFHARLLVVILQDVYNFKTCNIWGYGFPRIVNHVATMVVWNGQRYNFDPYFGIHYTDVDGQHITFDQLKNALTYKQFDKIRIQYATDKSKYVMTKVGDSAPQHEWVSMTSEEFYKHITALFEKNGSKTMLQRRFGHTDHLALMLLA